jgi:hypothetical protein
MHLAAEEVIRIEPAEHQVGVGHGGFGAAEAVADRPGLRAGTARSDLHQSGRRLDPRDRSAARADLDHVDDRHFQRQSGALDEAAHAPGLEIELVMRRTVLHQAHLGGGPAHVERDHAVEPGEARQERGRHGAGRRAGLDHADRKVLGLLHRRDAAARQHHIEPARESDVRQPHLEPVEIAPHQRLHIGVGAGRAGALELADLGRDLARQGQRQVRVRAAHNPGGTPFMRGIPVGVHERDRDRLDAVALDHLARNRGNRLLVEGHEKLALEIHPLADLAPPVARHQGRGRFEEQVVEVVAGLAADLDHVAKSLGGDQADGRAGALDHRVGHQRGAVHDAVQLGSRNIRLAQDARDAGDDCLARIVRRREQLAGMDEIAARIVQHEIGEGAADIDADADSACGHGGYLVP